VNGENTASYWRSKARPIIRAVIAEFGADKERLKKELRKAYPFGPRQFHPYKIWLDEVRRQTKPRASNGSCACGHGKSAHRGWCHAADCSCEKYRTDQPSLALPFGAA